MRLIDADALKQKQFGALGWLAGKDLAAAPTIDPEELRPKGEWKNGVCTACGFNLRVLTDGENDLEQWVWDEGFDYCPNCGAKMRGAE